MGFCHLAPQAHLQNRFLVFINAMCTTNRNLGIPPTEDGLFGNLLIFQCFWVHLYKRRRKHKRAVVAVVVAMAVAVAAVAVVTAVARGREVKGAFRYKPGQIESSDRRAMAALQHHPDP